ncbi:MAG: hypothetical protein K9L28_05875 [Synergistales bacterium]|nr:hypothetical protein [Synergistales bacterium]
MFLPRLMIADERKSGVVPPSVLLAAALKERGYRLRLFVAGPDERIVKLLEVCTGERVTVLDPFLAGGEKRLRFLFQHTADASALNLVVAPLAYEREEEARLLLQRKTLEIAEALSMPLCPCIYARMAAAVAARTMKDLGSQLGMYSSISIHAALFASVLNPREYQLLETELGRILPWLSFGYLPSNLEIPLPEDDLLFREFPGSMKFIGLKTTVLQLQGLTEHIQWPLFGALGKQAEEQTTSQIEIPGRAGGVAAVLRHPGLGGYGDNVERLLKEMGLYVGIFSVDDHIPVEADVIYISHGEPGYLQELLGNGSFRQILGKVVLKERRFFVNGGLASLFGERLTIDGEELQGLRFFPFAATCRHTVGQMDYVWIEAETTGPLLKENERGRGLLPQGVSLEGIKRGEPEWRFLEVHDRHEIGQGCWSIKKSLVTQAYLDPWSSIQSFWRWISF